MTIPTYDQFIFPLLQVLSEHPDGLRSRDAYDFVASRVGLNDEDRSAMLPSGRQAVYKNRIGWANDRLKRAELTEAPRRGMWKITDRGRAFVDQHPQGLDEATLRELTQVPADSTLRGGGSTPAPPESKPIQTQSPEEQIDHAIEELNESVASELLRLIHDASADFFERLVLDLLVAMGYGTPDIEAIQVGGPGDAGIDGVIHLDRLGLEKVYVQAKRWKGNNVGRPAIQAFYGALAGRRAAKGVFITASDFSKEARDYAEHVSDSIVLIDGRMLTRLMIQYGVGVSVRRTAQIVDVDSDYFDEA